MLSTADINKESHAHVVVVVINCKILATTCETYDLITTLEPRQGCHFDH